jgi:hypothetical protein
MRANCWSFKENAGRTARLERVSSAALANCRANAARVRIEHSKIDAAQTLG